MGGFRSAVLAATFAAILCSSACGAEFENFGSFLKPEEAKEVAALKTTDVGACLKSTDQALCLLKASQYERGDALKDDPRFANAPDILSKLDLHPEAAPENDQYDKHYVEPRRLQRRALAKALALDRQGASPAEALLGIKLFGHDLRQVRSFFGYSPTGSALRAEAYQSIWSDFQANQKLAPGAAAFPTKQLALAALAAWERELQEPQGVPSDSSALKPFVLAQVYASRRDFDAVVGVMRLDKETAPKLVLLRTLILTERFEDAAKATLELAGSGDPYYHDLVIEALIKAGRNDLATQLAFAVLGTPIKSHYGENDVAIKSIKLVALHGEKAEARAVVEHLDRVGRSDESSFAAANAVIAVTGWMELGDARRAESLTNLWRKRAEDQLKQAANNAACRGWQDQGAAPYCRGMYVAQMLRRMGRLEEGWQVEPNADASTYVRYEIADGSDFGRIQRQLEHEKDAAKREYALAQCVKEFRPKASLVLAEKCADQLISIAGDRQPTAREIELTRDGVPLGAYGAADAALALAGRAAQEGDDRLMRKMTDNALKIWTFAPPLNLGFTNSVDLERIATQELRLAGRL